MLHLQPCHVRLLQRHVSLLTCKNYKHSSAQTQDTETAQGTCIAAAIMFCVLCDGYSQLAFVCWLRKTAPCQNQSQFQPSTEDMYCLNPNTVVTHRRSRRQSSNGDNHRSITIAMLCCITTICPVCSVASTHSILEPACYWRLINTHQLLLPVLAHSMAQCARDVLLVR